MLWKVDGTKLHILGAAHVLDGPVKFRPAERKVIHQAGQVAFEADFRLPIPDLGGHYSAGQGLADELGDELFDKALDLGVQLGMSAEELRGMKPWLAQLNLTIRLGGSVGLSPEHGVDRAVMAIAEFHRRKLIFLEQVAEGLAVFAHAPGAEQLAALSALVIRPDETRADLLAIVEAWHQRNPTATLPVYEKWLRVTPRSCQAGIPDRNAKWMPQLLQLARAPQPTLAVVGALHMVGPLSLIELFAREGMTCSMEQS